MTKTDKQIKWETRIDEWKKSGLSKAKWCRENNVKEHQLYYWINKLQTDLATFPQSKEHFLPSWQAVSLMDERINEPKGSLILHLEDVKIEVPSGADLNILPQLIQVLQSC